MLTIVFLILLRAFWAADERVVQILLRVSLDQARASPALALVQSTALETAPPMALAAELAAPLTALAAFETAPPTALLTLLTTLFNHLLSILLLLKAFLMNLPCKKDFWLASPQKSSKTLTIWDLNLQMILARLSSPFRRVCPMGPSLLKD